MKKRKIMIVIEETGTHDGKGFNVYMDGDKERIPKIDPKDYSPAEFWGNQLFNMCIGILTKAGVIKTVHVNNKGKGH